MEIDSREDLIIENNQTEITEKVKKGNVHALLAFNPIGIIGTLIKNSKQDKRNRIQERWMECSNLVNYMPKSFLQLLTIKKGEDEIITPQESFVKYFSNKKMQDDPFLSSKFIEYFHSNQKYLEEKLLREKNEIGEDLDYVSNFGKEFEHILVFSKVPKSKKVNHLKKCGLIKRIRKIEQGKKVLLNGTGKYHFSARNNSYLRINKI